MRKYDTFLFLLIFLISCQKSKWNRRLATRSGKFRLTRYEINGKDSSHLIPSFQLDFKGKDPGMAIITELITDSAYSRGYNSCFNIEGAVNVNSDNTPDGLKLYLTFTNKQKIENALGLLELDDEKYGCTRSIRPIHVTRVNLTFDFPYHYSYASSDTSNKVVERYVFEKLDKQ